jgi:hypothetical protein
VLCTLQIRRCTAGLSWATVMIGQAGRLTGAQIEAAQIDRPRLTDGTKATRRPPDPLRARPPRGPRLEGNQKKRKNLFAEVVGADARAARAARTQARARLVLLPGMGRMEE